MFAVASMATALPTARVAILIAIAAAFHPVALAVAIIVLARRAT